MQDNRTDALAFDDDADAKYDTPIKHTHTDASGKRGSHTHTFKWGEYAAHADAYAVAHPEPAKGDTASD